MDAIVDIVGACIGLEMLGVEKVYCSPLPLNRGWVECAHGTMPVPAPATMELLVGFPLRPDDRPKELITPTGACLLAEYAERDKNGDIAPVPALIPRAIGYGAGKRDSWIPNLLRLVVGDTYGDSHQESRSERAKRKLFARSKRTNISDILSPSKAAKKSEERTVTLENTLNFCPTVSFIIMFAQNMSVPEDGKRFLLRPATRPGHYSWRAARRRFVGHNEVSHKARSPNYTGEKPMKVNTKANIRSVSVTKIRITATLLLMTLALGFAGTVARAADAVWIAQRALRMKIQREAGDRYGIRFMTAHVDRLPDGRRTVTGRGMFRRRGKTSQTFTYHSTVNIRDNSDRETGYDIR